MGGVKSARQMVSFLDDKNTLDAISRVIQERVGVHHG